MKKIRRRVAAQEHDGEANTNTHLSKAVNLIRVLVR